MPSGATSANTPEADLICRAAGDLASCGVAPPPFCGVIRLMINCANFLSQCFNGVVLGALLALISSGLTIIYGTLGVLNLAHGAMFMLGGYAGWLAYTY